MIIAY